VTIRFLLLGNRGMASSLGQFGISQARATRLGSLEGCRRSGTDGFALVLGDSRQDMDRQLVCMRIVGCDELYAGVHQGRDECEVSGQAIEFGNDELGLLFLRGSVGDLLSEPDFHHWLAAGLLHRLVTTE